MTPSQRKRMAILVAELERIRKDHRGRLAAPTVVAEATPKNAPLHPYFEWDDRKAAHQHRVEQARTLIQSVEIEMTQTDGTRVPVPAYVSLRGRRGDNKGYMSTQDVFSDRELRAMLLREALDDLAAFERRYKRLSALRPVFVAAKRVRRK